MFEDNLFNPFLLYVHSWRGQDFFSSSRIPRERSLSRAWFPPRYLLTLERDKEFHLLAIVAVTARIEPKPFAQQGSRFLH